MCFGNPRWPPLHNIGPYGDFFFFILSEATESYDNKLFCIEWSLYGDLPNVCFFVLIGEIQVGIQHSALFKYKNMDKQFFSETAKLFEPKLN